MDRLDPQIFSRARNPAATSHWVKLRSGRVTASGCPSKSRLASWPACGGTDLVTLQRRDEMPVWLPDECARIGLAWHHVPLSGRRLEDPEDTRSLARIPELLELLELPSTGLVLHCAAGMHRTGLSLYLLMRHAGLDPERALEQVQRARTVTAAELSRTTKKSGRLLDKAEAIFAAR